MSPPHRNSERLEGGITNRHHSKRPKRLKRPHYYNYNYNWYQYPPKWRSVYGKNGQRTPRTLPQQEPPRSPSPFSGSEEFTLRKIQKTSDMIKKALMMPQDPNEIKRPKSTVVEAATRVQHMQRDNGKNGDEKNQNRTRSLKRVMHYNVEEIQSKIMAHISKLSHGKKKNLICASSSGYDVAIQQIQKQKRLELSKVLRDMCSNHTAENSGAINSIIPDIDIDIESLPLDVIKQLSTTLDLNFDDTFASHNNVDPMELTSEVMIKDEIDDLDNCDDKNEDQVSCQDEVHNNVKVLSNIKTEFDEMDDTSNVLAVPSGDSPFMGIIIKEEMCVDNENRPPSIAIKNVCESSSEIKPLISKDTHIKSVCSQTDSVANNCISTQTDLTQVDFIKTDFKKDVNTWDEAVDAMLQIDEEIARLTKVRQSIFVNLKNKTLSEDEPELQSHVAKIVSLPKELQKTKARYDKPLEFDKIHEKILLIRAIGDTLLAATDNGNIFFINTSDGATRAVLSVSQSPITSFCTFMTKRNMLHLIVGSHEPQMHEYVFSSRDYLRTIDLKGCVQCLEQAWDYLFIGTTRGDLLRYSLKRSKVEFEELISDESVFVLKATQEGARYVLLVGTRNTPVCVRDAMSGLILRTMKQLFVPTVYSLLLENSTVYCGTTFHDILVFSFHDGSLIQKYEDPYGTGITCMKIVGNLLFASSHNGKIYVYNVKTHKNIGIIYGPGGAILSMEIVNNIIIVGTMPINFKSILISEDILKQNKV